MNFFWEVNMKSRIAILIFFSVLIFPCSSFGQEKDSITWIENDFAPVWIFEGPYKGRGGADLIQKLLIEKLTEYTHHRTVANISRAEIMMRKEENVCTSATFKTSDREAYGYFNTIPSSFISANGIITKKRNRHLFGNELKASLAVTLKNKDLRLGVTQDRKFSGKIDQLLEAHKDSSNVHKRASGDLTKGLIQMLLYDRVEYILGYDWELQYLVRELWSEEQADELIFIPIKETEPYLISYIHCSKNKWGKTVVNRIDEILKEEIPKPSYREIWEQWMSNKELYRKLYDEFYLKRIQ